MKGKAMNRTLKNGVVAVYINRINAKEGEYCEW